MPFNLSRLTGAVFALGLGAALAGCGDSPPAGAPAPAAPKSEATGPSAPLVPADKDAAVQKIYAQFAAGDMAALEPQFGPEFKTPEAAAALPQIRAAVPPEKPATVRVKSWKVDWSALTGPRTESLAMVHVYGYPDYTVEAETVLTRDYPARGGPRPWQIRGFHVDRKPVNHVAPAG